MSLPASGVALKKQKKRIQTGNYPEHAKNESEVMIYMAKDGTARGGARAGAGRKPKALNEKIEAGNPGGRTLRVIDADEIPDLDELSDMEGVNMPPPGEYLSAIQRDGTPLGADRIYIKVCQWLAAVKCDKLVSPQLVEQYAVSIARWIQCEEAITKYGFLGKHPTSGQPIQSPYVAMSHNYMKQSNQLWYSIFQVVKENASVEYTGTPNDDMMEMLLNLKGRKENK